MERTLAGRVWTSISRASTSTVRTGSSSRTITSISNASRSLHAHRQDSRFSRKLAQTEPSSHTKSLGRNKSFGLERNASLGCRAFSIASISRYADELKDRTPPAGAPTAKEANAKQADAIGESDSSISTVSLEGTLDKAEPPESRSPSETTTSDAPPQPSASTSSKSNSNTLHSHASALLKRLRSTTASLPSFDGLTSSSSLQTTVASITSQSRALLSHLRTKLSDLSTQYNTHTGYSAIEDLKSRISELERSLDSARILATTAKKTYLLAVQNRSASQRETNDLLSRKNSWDERDLSRYTELLRKEHALSKQETEAEKVLETSEGEVQASFDELMKAVMVRYHEEQIWSDRMRGMSTYGSLVVAGLNAFLFILAILLVEPYKRKKLAETFESRLVAAEQESRQLILASVDHFQRSLDAVLAPTTTSPVEQTAEAPLDAANPPLLDETEESLIIQEPAGPELALAIEAQRKREEERLVFASTLGVVVGAALSLLISACWS